MPDLITLKQAAALAGEEISPAALREAIKRGRLDGQRLGRDWVTTRQAVAAYLAQRHPGQVRGGRNHFKRGECS